MSLSESIKTKALELGFDVVGVTTAEPLARDKIDYLRHWLDKGCAAQMDYMHRNFDKRVNPAMLLQGARSVVCVGLTYKLSPAEGVPASTVDDPVGVIADFALFDDYHVFMKALLTELCDYISSQVGADRWRSRICVDSVPIAERALAQRAGMGFIGANHMLTSPDLGSQILLGLLITDIQLDPDKPDRTRCGACNKCVTACPTGALSPDGGFDSAKCISYLTIEHKGSIPDQIAAMMGNRLFGCDECTKACPHTRNAPPRKNVLFKLHPQRQRLNIREIADWTPTDFDECFAGSPVQRLGLERFKRNARICLRNL